MTDFKKIDADHYFNVYLCERYDELGYIMNYKAYNPPETNDFYLICFDRKGGYYYDITLGWCNVGMVNTPSCLAWNEVLSVML